jgi:hypothetical protein
VGRTVEAKHLPPHLAAVMKHAGVLLVDMTPRLRDMQRQRTVIAIPAMAT